MTESAYSFKIGINLPWFKIRCEDIIELYRKNFLICKKYNISIVRIFFVRWGLNPIYDKSHIGMLQEILHMASEQSIKIIPVLFHFTDFIDYRDGSKKEDFSRENNPFKKKDLNSFFQHLDADIMSSVDEVLLALSISGNVDTIELFNEIDLVPSKVYHKISRLNKLTAYVQRKYAFSIFASLADNFQYQKYKEVECAIDIHFYNYPYSFGFQNIEYFKEKKRGFIFGEFAKYSDSSHIDRKESLSFFISCFYGSLLNKCTISPFSWRGDEVLGNDKYLKGIEVFDSMIPILSGIAESDPVQVQNSFVLDNITAITTHKGNPTIKKMRARLLSLVMYPKLILREFRAIKKLFLKLFGALQADSVLIRSYSNEQHDILYIETAKQGKRIVFKSGEFSKYAYKNLQTGETGNGSELNIYPFENYIFILERVN